MAKKNVIEVLKKLKKCDRDLDKREGLIFDKRVRKILKDH